MTLEYYLRVLRVAGERRMNTPAQVGLIAAQALGIHPTQHIGRLGAIYNQLRGVKSQPLRWGIVVQAIVKATGNSPAGDPLDYVQKLAERLASERAEPASGGGGQRGLRRSFPAKRLKGGQADWDLDALEASRPVDGHGPPTDSAR